MLFNIPVAKCNGETVEVTVDAPENIESFPLLLDNARHGMHQRVNDATAGLKRKDFASDEEFESAAYNAALKVATRINAGEFKTGRKSADPVKRAEREKVKALAEYSLDEIMAALELAKR